MGRTSVSAIQASSVTLSNWQHGVKGNCCNFATFNRVFNNKDLFNPNGTKYSKRWLENES